MKCIIVDDEISARVIIKKLCDEITVIDVVAEFENVLEAIAFINNEQVDLILLDIHLNDLNGLDMIRALKEPPKIILISSDKTFAFESYEFDCIVDYISKPVSPSRLKIAVDKVKKDEALTENFVHKKNDIYINIDKCLIIIDLNNIILIESKGDYIKIKTEQKNYIVHTTLKNINKKLPSSMFLKIHRSYIINLAKITSIEDNAVVIDKEIIPISRLNRGSLISRLNLL